MEFLQLIFDAYCAVMATIGSKSDVAGSWVLGTVLLAAVALAYTRKIEASLLLVGVGTVFLIGALMC